MTSTQFWFMDRSGVQQQAIGADGLFAAVSRGELLPESMFYDPAVGQWQPAAQSPLLAATFAAASAPAYPPPASGFAPVTEANPTAKVITIALTVLAAGLAFFSSTGKSGAVAMGAALGAPLWVFVFSWLFIKISKSQRPWRVRAWVAGLIFIGQLGTVAKAAVAGANATSATTDSR